MTTITIFGSGDIACQYIEKKEEWDFERIARQGGVCAVLMTPCSYWYIMNVMKYVKLNPLNRVVPEAGSPYLYAAANALYM